MQRVAVRAVIQMPAQCGCAADRDGAEQAPLAERQDMARLQCLAMAAHNVSDMEAGPKMSGRGVHGSRWKQRQWIGAGVKQVRGHVQVAFGGADGGMAEQGLDHAEIGARFQQQRGVGVPE